MIGIDIIDLDPDYKGGSNTYCTGLIQSLTNKKFQTIYVFVNKDFYIKRKLKDKENIKYIIFNNSILKNFLNKLYNRLLPILYFFFSIKLLLFIDFHIRNFLFSKFKFIVEKNCNFLITPNVTLTHYNLNVKNIVNIQDIQQKHFPHFFSKTEVARREYRYYNTLFYADHLVFSSKFIYRDVLKFYNFIKKKKISIIPEGVNCDIYKYKKDKNLIKKKYFFLPAQLWPHKNHLTVIKSFNEFNKKNKYKFKLFICGKSFQDSSIILDLIKNTKNCFYLGLVSQKLLIKLMSSSIATITPSLYESSSLTLLEAIACNSLVIASDIKPNKEKKNLFKIFYFKRTNIDSLKQIFFKVSAIDKKIKKNYLIKNALEIKSHTWKSFNTKWLNICKN